MRHSLFHPRGYTLHDGEHISHLRFLILLSSLGYSISHDERSYSVEGKKSMKGRTAFYRASLLFCFFLRTTTKRGSRSSTSAASGFCDDARVPVTMAIEFLGPFIQAEHLDETISKWFFNSSFQFIRRALNGEK